MLPQGLSTPAMPLPGMHLVAPGAEPDVSRSRFGFQPQNSARAPQFQEQAATTLLSHVSIGQPVTKALPPVTPILY